MEIALLPFVESAFSLMHGLAKVRWDCGNLCPAPPALSEACNKIGGMTGRRTPGPLLRQRWTTYNPSTTSSIRTGLLRFRGLQHWQQKHQTRTAARGCQIEEADFWKLPLNAETSAHVPRLLALASVIAKPEAFSVELAELSHSDHYPMSI